MPADHENLTDDEQAEVARAVDAGEIMPDDDIAKYVQESTITDIMREAGGNVVLAKRLLAAERARGDDARSTLVDKLAAAIPAPDDSDQADADPDAITRENKHAWWCPRCDHSNTLLTATCGGCGATRDGDRVT